MALTTAQQRVLAILPKVSGFISLICSGLVVYSVLISPRKRSQLYHRFMLVLSIVDLSNSFWMGVSTWPIHASSEVEYALGDDYTCTAQGFFIQCGISASILNGSLSVYYLLTLKYEWKETLLIAYEKVFYGIPLLWGIGTAIISLPLKLFNNANLWCWIASFPEDCEGDDCIRGRDSNIYRWAFYYGPLWTMILLVTFIQITIFLHVQKILLRATERAKKDDGDNEEAADSSSTDGSTDENIKRRMSAEERAELRDRKTREVATQCFLYALSFYLSWFALTAVRIQQVSASESGFPLLAIAAFMTPLQGLPNLFTYVYPNYNDQKLANPNGNFLQWFRDSL